MDILHAPWRIDYILAPKRPVTEGQPSIFTDIAQSSDDEANYVVARSRTCYVVLNTFPYNGGHLMVVPYRQTAGFDELTDDELLDLMHMTRRSVQALREALKPQGFNMGVNLGKCAGAGIIEHLHVHIVPRWEGDTNFMPVLANTRVVPEALKETAAKIRAALAAQTDQS